jgi:c(7)-type cytochrome triheme protein
MQQQSHKLICLLSILTMICTSVPVIAVPPGKTVTWEGGGAGRVIFDGSLHKDKGFKCMDCHTKIFTKMSQNAPSVKMKMADMYDGRFCGVCHNGKNVFSVKDKSNCARCHK